MTAVGALLSGVLLSGCIPANPDDDTYKAKASVTVGGALSQVATVQKILESLHQDKLFRTTAIAQMRSSQSSLDTNAGAFNEVHPPPDLDHLYGRINTLLSDANDTAFQARLAIERHEPGRYPRLARDLGKIASQLSKLQTRLP
jgi:hypothetical protein